MNIARVASPVKRVFAAFRGDAPNRCGTAEAVRRFSPRAARHGLLEGRGCRFIQPEKIKPAEFPPGGENSPVTFW
jgi:hypothetical protein